MEQTVKFNPDEIVLTLSVMSDIHISGSWGIVQSEQKFKNALHFANKVASNKIDAFLFTGDFTDAMNSKANVSTTLSPEEFERKKAEQNKIEFEILRRCFSEAIDKDAEIIYCLGNHDSNSCNNTERFITEFASRDEIGDNKNFERMYRTDTDLEALHKGMRHCVYKDYHFLCIDMENDRTEMVAFLKKNLDEIVAVDPDRATPCHLKSWGHTNRSENFVVKNNIFDRCDYRLIEINANKDEWVPTLESNVYCQYSCKDIVNCNGKASQFTGETIKNGQTLVEKDATFVSSKR